jgi:hypothetical protein
VGDVVVGGAEGPFAEAADAGWEDSGDAVDLGRLEGFGERERREDAGDSFGEHGFAGTGRAQVARMWRGPKGHGHWLGSQLRDPSGAPILSAASLGRQRSALRTLMSAKTVDEHEVAAAPIDLRIQQSLAPG